MFNTLTKPRRVRCKYNFIQNTCYVCNENEIVYIRNDGQIVFKFIYVTDSFSFPEQTDIILCTQVSQ